MKLMRRLTGWIVAVLTIAMLAPQGTVHASSLSDSLKSKKIVHACGGYNGIRHANCEESLIDAIKNGSKVIEIDFMLTSDGVLVCDHAFDSFGYERVSYEKFKNEKPAEKGTPMSAKRAIKLLKDTDIKLIVDTQDKNLIKVYKELLKICKKEKAEAYFDNIIPQIYYEEQYKKMESFHNFSEYIFEAYRMTGSPKKGGYADFNKFAKICKRHKKIKYVAFYKNFVTKEAVKKFKKCGVGVIAHPVNSKEDFRRLKKMGVAAVMTDFL